MTNHAVVIIGAGPTSVPCPPFETTLAEFSEWSQSLTWAEGYSRVRVGNRQTSRACQRMDVWDIDWAFAERSSEDDLRIVPNHHKLPSRLEIQCL